MSEGFQSPEGALSSATARFHGIVANIFLSSAVLGLVVIYYSRFGDNDKRWLSHIFVPIFALLCMAETVVLWNVIDIIHVEHLYDPMAAELRSSYLPAERLQGVATGLATCITVATQGYFARRAWLVLGKSVAFGVLAALLLGFVASVGLALAYYIFNRVWGDGIGIVAVSYYSSAFSIDCINTAILLYKLLSFRSSSEHSNTRSLIMRYLLIIINSSALSSTFALITLLLQRLIATEEWYQVTFWPLSKIYALSLMIQLITRQSQDGINTRTSGNGRSPNVTRVAPMSVGHLRSKTSDDNEKSISLADMTPSRDRQSLHFDETQGIVYQTHTSIASAV